MRPSLDARVVVPPQTLVRELDGEAVILSMAREQYFELDDVGTRMLAVLVASETIAQAHQQLLSEYAVDPDRLREDLLDLIERLLERGIVQVAPTSPDLG